jgi:hypothetical protein
LLSQIAEAAVWESKPRTTPGLQDPPREAILREKDGPMLLHGLQGFQGSQILIPTRRDLQPDRDRSEGIDRAALDRVREGADLQE